MMNIVLWMLAGAILGWVGFSYMRFNEERGLLVSAIIGAIGGLVGGKLIEPMFMDAQTVAGAFSTSGLVFAAIAAAGLLFAGNLVYNRWGV
jgi:uncharacterized membrane protein YeaQ/YmgE (transglycosylase-associated protein family)